MINEDVTIQAKAILGEVVKEADQDASHYRTGAGENIISSTTIAISIKILFPISITGLMMNAKNVGITSCYEKLRETLYP